MLFVSVHRGTTDFTYRRLVVEGGAPSPIASLERACARSLQEVRIVRATPEQWMSPRAAQRTPRTCAPAYY